METKKFTHVANCLINSFHPGTKMQIPLGVLFCLRASLAALNKNMQVSKGFVTSEDLYRWSTSLDRPGMSKLFSFLEGNSA